MNTNYLALARSAGVVGNLVDKLGKTPGAKEKAIVLIGQVYPLISSISKVDFKAVLEERKTMTDEEKKQVNDEFDSAFSLSNGRLEEVLENAIDFAVSAVSVVSSGAKLLEDIKSIQSKSAPQLENASSVSQDEAAKIPMA